MSFWQIIGKSMKLVLFGAGAGALAYTVKKTKPFGYLTALKQSTRNMQNWIKYKAGSSNKERSKLLTLKEERRTFQEKISPINGQKMS